ncbi:MAG: ATP-binding protein [Alphaproteobacteria bacterium]
MLLLRLGIKSVSLRAVLLAMVAFASVPVLIFGVIAVSLYADSERQRAKRELQESARGIAQAIDSRFLGIVGVTSALASSPLVRAGNYEEFKRHLRAATDETGIQFQLFTADGSPVIDTIESATIRRAYPDGGVVAKVTSGQPVVTDLGSDSRGSLHARVMVAITVNGAVRWVLHGIATPEHFQPIMDEPGVPEDWIVSITDRNAVHFMRSHNNEKFVGLPLVPKLAEHVKAHRTEVIETVTLEGIPALSAVAYAPDSGWVTAIGLPRNTLNAPLREQLFSLGLLGAILIGVALFLGLLLARYLDRTMRELGTLAREAGAGSTVEPHPTAIMEVAQTAAVLQNVSVELRNQSEQLRTLNASLEEKVHASTTELVATNRKLVDEMKRREESEAQLRQMQKMEAVGQLTGGIAHDFNNLLSVIMNSLHLMQRRLKRGEGNVDRLIDSALDGAERAATLTKRLLAFSRQQPLAPVPVDANRLLAGMDGLLRRTLPENIGIEMVLFGGLWQTSADPTALDSAIINLAANARDAMPEGGRLTLETGNVELDETYAERHPEAKAGQYVMIAATDTGTGMTPDVVEKAFDPFFTTKAVGMGTGLGLSQVHGFMRQTGGLTNIYSEPGVGTSVKLYLPRYHNSGQSDTKPSEDRRIMARGSGQVVLVVEDDADVRWLVVQMLEDLGYAPLEAESPQNALDLLDATPQISILMTDVVMPQMNGRVLADKAVKKRPDLKVLFTTGYTRNAIIHNGVLDPGVNLINKPFKIEALARKLSEMLDG